MLRLSAVAATVGLAAAHTRSTFDAKEFRSLGRAPKTSRMVFTAALPHQNMDKLDALLADISDPKSANYGNWLSREEVNELTAPAPEVRAEVAAWLASQGAFQRPLPPALCSPAPVRPPIISLPPLPPPPRAAGAECYDWPTSLRCEATAEVVEKAFATKVTAYEHVGKGKTIYRVAPSDEFTLPSHLAEKLKFVTNMYDFPTRRMRLGSGITHHGPKTGVEGGRKLQGTDYMVALETLWSFYGVNKLKGAAASTTGEEARTAS